VLFVPSALQAAQQGGKPKVSAPFLLAGGAGNQQSPSMAGNLLVYTECKSADCDISGVDLTTRQSFPVAAQGWDEDEPSTDGVRAVWRDARNVDLAYRSSDNEVVNFDLYGTYIGDKQAFAVSRDVQAQSKPSVWGNTVVWSDFRDADSPNDPTAGKVYALDIPSGKEFRVSKANSAQVRPVTNGNVVVWVDYRNEPDPNGKNADIYAYDLNTGQDFPITAAPDTQTDPAISGNIVVWADWRRGDNTSDIYGYDLATHKEFPIDTAPGSQVQPAISGNIVVWTDWRNEKDPHGTNTDIYGYDLGTGQEFPIYVGPGPQRTPSVSGNIVAWMDESKGNQDRDIMGATIGGIATSPAPQGPPALPGQGSRRFPETGRQISGLFYDYWNKNGGLPQQGYPISDVMREVSPLDGKTYTVQYFERAVFEYHPEQKPPYNVLLSQLGTFRYKQKYPNGAPNQQPNTSPGAQFFPQTGHTVGGLFLDYWNAHGGLPQQGYPISDEFTETSDLNGQTYTVQYFERAVFEYHPENQPPYNVLLSQLGTFRLQRK
jgi:beta propeller repeat protein